MELLIRPCTLRDAAALHALNVSEMGYDYPPDKTAHNLRQLLQSGKDAIFVAEAGGRVVGYVHASDYDLLCFPHMKNIMGIAVAADHRRKGIGRALLAAVETWARQTGACGVRLVSGAARTGAHAFYRQCGYGGDKQQINFKKMFHR